MMVKRISLSYAQTVSLQNPVENLCISIHNRRMNKLDAIAALNHHADAIRTMGATALYLYGSTGRNDAGQGSDIDLFIDYDPASRFNAFDLVGIKLMLEEKLQIPVDITTRDGLHKRLRQRIETSAIRVF